MLHSELPQHAALPLRQFARNARRGRATPWVEFAALALAQLSAGCNECDPGALRCNGTNLELCESRCSDGCGPSWSSQSCTSCVEPAHGEPFCVLSTTREPRCDGARGFCDDQTAVTCESGYRVAETRCDSGKVCVRPELHEPNMLNDSAALCALAAEPDPACPDQQGYNNLCLGDAIVDCESRFRLQSYDCPAPSHCVWPDGGAPTCE